SATLPGAPACGLVAAGWSVPRRSGAVSRAESVVPPTRAAPSAPAVAVVSTSPATSAPRICQVISLLGVVNPRVGSWHSAVQRCPAPASYDEQGPDVRSEERRV